MLTEIYATILVSLGNNEFRDVSHSRRICDVYITTDDMFIMFLEEGKYPRIISICSKKIVFYV